MKLYYGGKYEVKHKSKKTVVWVCKRKSFVECWMFKNWFMSLNCLRTWGFVLFFYLYICSELKRKYKSGLSLSTNKAAGFIMYWDFIEFVFAANRRGDKTTAGNSHRNADLTHTTEKLSALIICTQAWGGIFKEWWCCFLASLGDFIPADLYSEKLPCSAE